MMISVSSRKWQEKKVNARLVEKINQNYNFSKLLSQLIISRNFSNEEIYIIKNKLSLSNVFQKDQDFIKSVKILKIKKILVF